jgi:hypothetical protein
VGLIPGPEETPQAASNAIESRARQVESIFNSVYLRPIGLNNVEIPSRNVHFLRSKVFDLTESSLSAYPNPFNLSQFSQNIPPAQTEKESPTPVEKGNGGNPAIALGPDFLGDKN